MTRPVRFGVLIAAAALAGCLAAPAARQDRQQRVAGWLVEDRTDEDGGRLVQIGRDGSRFSVDHHLGLWRGDGTLSLGWSIRFGDCNAGDNERVTDTVGGEARVTAARERLADFLAECGARPLQIDAMLDGLDAAYPLFEEWAAQLRAAAAGHPGGANDDTVRSERIAWTGDAGDSVPVPILGREQREGAGAA